MALRHLLCLALLLLQSREELHRMQGMELIKHREMIAS